MNRIVNKREKTIIVVAVLTVFAIFPFVKMAGAQTQPDPDPDPGTIFDIRNGVGEPGSEDRKVEVWLKNEVNVAGIQVDICDEGDCLSLASVELTDCTSGFTIFFEDDYSEAGCARLVLYGYSEDDGGFFIAPGDGPVLILHYNVSSVIVDHAWVMITPENLLIADEDGNPLTAEEDPGKFFFGIYGDLWPYDEEEDLAGDGQINIFDLNRAIQLCLGFDLPAPVELVASDLPTGFNDCQAPDGVINIFDILEMVEMILGNDNSQDCY